MNEKEEIIKFKGKRLDTGEWVYEKLVEGLENIARGQLQVPSFEKYAVNVAKQLIKKKPQKDCPECGGNGKSNWNKCTYCKGK